MSSSRLDRLAPRGDVTDEAGAGGSHLPAPATNAKPGRPSVIRHRKFLVAFYDANGDALRSETILTSCAHEAERISNMMLSAEQRHRTSKIKVQEMESVHD